MQHFLEPDLPAVSPTNCVCMPWGVGGGHEVSVHMSTYVHACGLCALQRGHRGAFFSAKKHTNGSQKKNPFRAARQTVSSEVAKALGGLFAVQKWATNFRFPNIMLPHTHSINI